MRLDKTLVIAKREFLTRVKTKGFWIATVGLPLFMGAVYGGPAAMLASTRAEQRIVIVDTTGAGLGLRAAKELESGELEVEDGFARFEVEVAPPEADREAQRAALDRRVLDEEIDAWVWIEEEGLAADRVEYHSETLSNFVAQGALEERLSDLVREWRLARAGYDSAEIGRLTRSLDLETVRVSEAGSRAEGGAGAILLAVGLFLILYTMLLIYGSQVLQGVLEEKGSRIVEVITSAVSPAELLVGKLAGICLLALTQLAVWIGTAALFLTPGLLAARLALPEGVELPTLRVEVIAHFFVLFILGFLLFATFYAAIGASFNSLQEAQQYAGFAMIFIIGPIFFLGPVLNDPDSTVAVVTSLIPLFTPLIMPLRIALKMPPLWQILLAYALTGGAVAGMIWIGARIYRVGILMYGKKPTIQEIWRWVRYA